MLVRLRSRGAVQAIQQLCKVRVVDPINLTSLNRQISGSVELLTEDLKQMFLVASTWEVILELAHQANFRSQLQILQRDLCFNRSYAEQARGVLMVLCLIH